MKDKPLVSILIPLYNHEFMVATAIESAISQTYSNIEIIVVDNCSTDNSFEVASSFLRKDSRIKCFRDEKNIGPVGNWIRCVELCSGEYVKIVFSDDWLSPNAIERYIAPMIERQDIGFSYAATDVHYEDRIIKGCWSLHKEGQFPSSDYLKGVLMGTVPWSPGCALFRRKDIERWLVRNLPNRFDLNCNSYGMGNDLMPYLKACDEYPYFYHIKETLAHFRAHPTSMTVAVAKRDPYMGFKCYFSVFAHFLSSSTLPSNQKQRLQSLLFLNLIVWATKKTLKSLKPWYLIRDAKRNYEKMFPSNYEPYKFDWSIKETSYLLLKSGVNTLRAIFARLANRVKDRK